MHYGIISGVCYGGSARSRKAVLLRTEGPKAAVGFLG